MYLQLQILSGGAFNILLDAITAAKPFQPPAPLVLLVGGVLLPRSSGLLRQSPTWSSLPPVVNLPSNSTPMRLDK
jgi:hypothetical protein